MSNGLPPPLEFAWDTPISDLVTSIFDLSADLTDNPPRLVMQGNRLQVNWQQSGLADPQAQSLIYITFAARPVAPATIVINEAAPAVAPTIASISPNTAPAGADVTLDITGTGFSAGSTVNVGTAYGLVPTSVNPTSLNVTVLAANIALPGTLEVSVTNSDNQESNALALTLT